LKVGVFYLYEDLKERPLWLLRDIFEFLEVDPDFVPPNLGVSYNVSGLPKSTLHKALYDIAVRYNPIKPVLKKILPEKTRHRMINNFREDILKLQDLIDRDLSHWLR